MTISRGPWPRTRRRRRWSGSPALASPAKLFIHRRIPKGEAPASRPIQSTHATHDVAKQAIRGVWVSFAGRCRSNCGVIDRSIGRSRAWTAIDRARKHTVHGVLSQHQLFSLATGMVPFFFFPFLALFFLNDFGSTSILNI